MAFDTEFLGIHYIRSDLHWSSDIIGFPFGDNVQSTGL